MTAVPLGRAAGVCRQLALSWMGARVLGPRLSPADRRALSLRLARRTLRALGVRVLSRGAPPARGAPLLVVANHVSWLDVYALNAFLEARFVAKSETATWPLVGAITRGFDAIFIARGSLRDASRVRGVVATALASGERVVVFPEATTTDGASLHHFHPALVQAALDARVPVLPVAIRYRRPCGALAPEAAFVDDMTFVGSLARIMGARGLRAELVFGTALSAADGTRKEIARRAQGFVAEVLGLPEAAVERRTSAPAPRLKMAV